jgi:tetratricopeptide (TPR) repeat protein
MARDADHDLGELPDLGSALDRAAHWVGQNPAPFLAVVAGILLVAGAIGLVRWLGHRSEIQAAEAVAAVRADFLKAMGAPAGAIEFTEPANPETGRKAREEGAARFAEVAAAHEDSAAGVEAWIEAGNLREELGQRDEALEAWKRAVAASPARSPLRGLALERLAAGYENRGAWAEAAAAHEEAAGIESFPLRHFAMANAARSFDAAGDRERAVTLAARVASEAPELELPDVLGAKLEELRAGQAGEGGAPAPSAAPEPSPAPAG